MKSIILGIRYCLVVYCAGFGGALSGLGPGIIGRRRIV